MTTQSTLIQWSVYVYGHTHVHTYMYIVCVGLHIDIGLKLQGYQLAFGVSRPTTSAVGRQALCQQNW